MNKFIKRKDLSVFIILIFLYFTLSIIFRMYGVLITGSIYSLYYIKESFLIIILSIFIYRRLIHCSTMCFITSSIITYQSIKLLTILSCVIKSTSMIELMLFLYNPIISIILSVLVGVIMCIYMKLTIKLR